jgi:predicted chitinase
MFQNFYQAIVESRKDPLKLGRCQVRVFGVHTESLTLIPTEDLPWATILMPPTSASISGIGNSPTGLVEGSLVMVVFLDGESKQQPMIVGSVHGIPQKKNAFSAAENDGTTTESESPTQPDQTDSNVDTQKAEETPTETGDCCSSVDSSAMVAKFGSNVTTVCETLCAYGIKNPYAVVAILANVAKECGFKPQRESMKYSSADRLRAIFPSKFNSMSDTDIQKYVNNEQTLANYVYSNREGNGDAASGDGYKYRGGGLIQLTFKNNYISIGSKIGVDLAANPDKVNDPSIAAKVVAQYMINRYGGAGRLNFSDLNTALSDVTRKINPGGVDNDLPKVTSYASLCSVIGDPSTKKAADKELAKTVPAGQVKPDGTISDGIPDSHKTNDDMGFKDPNNVYPLEDFLKEPDVNRLARRITKMTPVEVKRNNRRKSIKSVDSEFFEPPIPYNAKYPYNHVRFSESGHLEEVDDTPSAERLHWYHTAGTYQEIDAHGTRVNKIVGDDFTIIERNGYVYVDGVIRLTTGSHAKLLIQGNMDVRVNGDLTYDVGGDIKMSAAGSVNFTAGSETHIYSGGSVNVQGSGVYWQSGTAKGYGASAGTANDNDYPFQQNETAEDQEVIDLDDADEEEVTAAREKAIKEGKITQAEVDEAKNVESTQEDTKEPDVNIDAYPASCSAFINKSDIPSSIKLSQYFTLGSLTESVVFSHTVVPNLGKTKGEIVCNLKQLAENCLDKIKSKYPNMMVTCTFRPNSNTSQHNIGQAADIQFTGASKAEYFEIAKWIKSNVLFDQLLLEYKTTGTKLPWIHISYTESPRRQVMTFLNNTKYADGLHRIE